MDTGTVPCLYVLVQQNNGRLHQGQIVFHAEAPKQEEQGKAITCFMKPNHSHVLLLFHQWQCSLPVVKFDTDSFLLKIDNCASALITNCLDDFV